MVDNKNFGRLVSGLSLDERHMLLEKLKGQSNMSVEPLFSESMGVISALDIEAEFSKLPWYYRVWYTIQSFFHSRTPVDIYGDYQVAVLGSKIEEKYPGLYDYQRKLLLPAFHRQMIKLKDAARFFYSALDMSVNRDRGAFFAFLGSLEMADIHKRLQEETEPHFIAANHPDASENEIRQIALKAMDDAMAMITEDYRHIMYFHARSLNCLKELSSFLYDRVIMAFGSDSAANGETCSANVLRELLVSLNNILFSLKSVPPLPLLQSLFVFILHDRTEEPEFDINRESRLLLTKAESSLTVIREFNKQVPLTWIIRCATREMSYSSREISGGEDWFVVYRDYWKRRVESLLAEYMKNRCHEELRSSFRQIFNSTELIELGNVESEANPDGVPIKEAFALSFLLTFYSVVFLPDINMVLRPILVDGKFHKKENYIEFVEGYNNLIKLEDEIKKFERGISPSGDYGKRYSQARQEMSLLPIKRRKIQVVVEEASEDAVEILERAHDASKTMINVLNGIILQDFASKYDSLSNLSKFAGKDSEFIAELKETVQKFQHVVKILDDIKVVESYDR